MASSFNGLFVLEFSVMRKNSNQDYGNRIIVTLRNFFFVKRGSL